MKFLPATLSDLALCQMLENYQSMKEPANNLGEKLEQYIHKELYI